MPQNINDKQLRFMMQLSRLLKQNVRNKFILGSSSFIKCKRKYLNLKIHKSSKKIRFIYRLKYLKRPFLHKDKTLTNKKSIIHNKPQTINRFPGLHVVINRLRRLTKELKHLANKNKSLKLCLKTSSLCKLQLRSQRWLTVHIVINLDQQSVSRS